MGGAERKRQRKELQAVMDGQLWANNIRGQMMRNRRLPTGVPIDFKVFDVGFSNLNFTLAGTFACLNAPIVGPETYQRIGRRIFMKSLQIKGAIILGGTSVQDISRVLVVYDKQPNAALPVLADLVQNSNAGLASNNLSFPNINNRDRFVYLKDYKILTPSFTVTAGVITNDVILDPIFHSFNFDWTIGLRKLEATYNAVNGGTVADITTGSLFIVAFDGNNAGTVSCAFSSRLTYTD
jgi:hypothetical protein